MPVLDQIPPLPRRTVEDFFMLACPWCGEPPIYDHIDAADEYTCRGCNRRFELELKADGETLVAVGCRSDADLSYMAAMGVNEMMVDHHHHINEPAP